MNWILHLTLLVCGLGSAVSLSKTTCNCGWINKGRIIGGKETSKHKYPLMAAVIDTESGMQGCGGAVISPWHILTAAHCSPDSPKQMNIRLGVHNWRKEKGDDYEIAQIINHEKFDAGKAIYDLALFVTKREIKFGPNVGPVCMPNKRLAIAGQNVTLIGWGDIKEDGPSSDVLREVVLDVVTTAECKKKWGPRDRAFFDKTICTFTPKKDTCQFDSGGPMLWRDPELNRLVLAGTVSYGEGCAGPKPGIYTDVSAFLDWINGKIAASKPGTKTCTKA